MVINFETYLDKHAIYSKLIEDSPLPDLKLIVIIPAYNEPDLVNTLQSLYQCEPTRYPVEIIVLINHSEKATDEIKKINRQVFQEMQNWCKTYSSEHRRFFCLIKEDLPEKHAGAGLARKILMDEAIRRFSMIEQTKGILASLDADTLVSPNYLKEIEQAFLTNAALNAAIFYFEHPIDEAKLNEKETLAIIQYELYLRYFKHVLASTGFPYSFYTIGSNFAVSSNVYVKQGGMNRKQGGEDFYFLHKVFPLGQCLELPHIKVYPSARVSDRVPFGTGPALQKIITEGQLLTYHPEYFNDLKSFFNRTTGLFKASLQSITETYQKLPISVQNFIGDEEFLTKINELNQNSASLLTFIHRFYEWFNAFKIIKFLNQQELSTRIPVEEACQLFLKKRADETSGLSTARELLQFFRRLDKGTA